MTVGAWLLRVLASYRPLDVDQRLAGFARILEAEVLGHVPVGAHRTDDPGRTGHAVTQPGDPDADRVKRRLHVAHIAHQLHELRPGDDAVMVPAKRARRRAARRVVAFERSA